MNRDLLYILAPYIRKSLIFRLSRIIYYADIHFLLLLRKLHDSHLSIYNKRVIIDNIIANIRPSYRSKYYRYNKRIITLHHKNNARLFIIYKNAFIYCHYFEMISVGIDNITLNYGDTQTIINTPSYYIICDKELTRIIRYYIKNSSGEIFYI
jgi:hypothetical protein